MDSEQMEQACDALEKQELDSEEEIPEREEQEGNVQVNLVEEDEEESGDEQLEEQAEAEAKGLTYSDAETDESVEGVPEPKWNPEEEEQNYETESEKQQNLEEGGLPNPEQDQWQNLEEDEQSPAEENKYAVEEEEYSTEEDGQTLEEEKYKGPAQETRQTEEEEKQILDVDEQQCQMQEEVEMVEPNPMQVKDQEAPGEQPEVGPDDQQVSFAEEEERQQASMHVLPGSLSFAFLEDKFTKKVLCASRILIVLKGLPGSGKSCLASAIKEVYKDSCSVFSADDYSEEPESYGASECHKALDAALLTCLTSGTAVVVVDDTNHTPSRLAQLAELAEEHQYCTMFVEPHPSCSQDVEQLAQKSQRELTNDQIQALKTSLEETSLPLFYGWFLCHPFQEKLRSLAVSFLKNLNSMEAFRKNITDYTGDTRKDFNLEEHFHDKNMLHCTTKFCDYGKSDATKDYAEKQAVKENYGRVSTLVVDALFVTPRTLGAKVTLTEEQLQLWPRDAEEDTMPRGSHAHITLSCAESVELVQTGLDLLELVRLQLQGQEGEVVQESGREPLSYYGKGMWVLHLQEPFLAPACFSSFYGHKKQDEKEEEKKKRKCIVQ